MPHAEHDGEGVVAVDAQGEGEAKDALALLVPKPKEVVLGDRDAGRDALKLGEPLEDTLLLGERELSEEALCLEVRVEHCVAERVAQLVLLEELQGDDERDPLGEAL